MKKVLFIAYHFPPQAGSSGFLRTLKFVRYLPQHSWHPTVLSVNPRAYERSDNALLSQVPTDVQVLRPFCLDVSKDLSVNGRYPGILALPDRWSSWALTAIPAGLRAIRKNRITAMISTYPIATAVLIGLHLKKITRLPWVLDLRDSMTEPDYPRDPRTRRVYQWLERCAVAAADQLIFTAPSAKRMYLDRYPNLRDINCQVIHNGYDEDDFREISGNGQPYIGDRPLRLLHLGLLYPEERDPRAFFEAVSILKNNAVISPSSIAIELRASGSEDYYSRLLSNYGIEDIVTLASALPYHDGLKHAASADALLLFQDASCNHQIPAKIYEYMRLKKPIFALTCHDGDTAGILRSTGATVAELKNRDEILLRLPCFLKSVRSNIHPVAAPEFFTKYERRALTNKLVDCLNSITHGKGIGLTQSDVDPPQSNKYVIGGVKNG